MDGGREVHQIICTRARATQMPPTIEASSKTICFLHRNGHQTPQPQRIVEVFFEKGEYGGRGCLASASAVESRAPEPLHLESGQYFLVAP